MIRVVGVEPLTGYRLRVQFANGETRDVLEGESECRVVRLT